MLFSIGGNKDYIFTQCVKMSAAIAVYTMQAFKFILPGNFLPSLTPVNLPRGSVNGSLNIQCLRNRGACVIERRLSNFCLQNKTAAADGKCDNGDQQCRRCLYTLH